MGGGSVIGVVALTAAAGGCAALGLATFLIWWIPVSNFEGGAGAFAVIVTGLGLIGGSIVGLVVATSVRSGFATAQMYAIGIVAALTVAAGILVMVFDDDGPKIDGDQIVLETELRFPRDWKPDNLARSENGSGCWAQKSSANESPETKPSVLWQQKNSALHPLYRNSVLGHLVLKTAPESDGQWVVSCVVELAKTTSPRYMRIYAGHKADVTIRIPLPRHPGPGFQQWSQWSSGGFIPQAGKPAALDFAFRFKVQRKTEYDKAHTEEPESEKAAAIPPDAPLAQWLPFFESSRGNALKLYEVVSPAAQAVNARATELPSLMRSSDRDVVRRAVFAMVVLDPIPAFLIDPLAASGSHTIELTREARANSLPGDPDLAGEQVAYEFFSAWGTAMDRAGPAGAPARRKVLEEINREVHGNTSEGGIHQIAEQVAKDLAKLGAAAQ